VHHRLDLVLLQQGTHPGAVANVAGDEWCIEHRLAKSARQVIEHDYALAALAQLQGNVAADVARAAGD